MDRIINFIDDDVGIDRSCLQSDDRISCTVHAAEDACDVRKLGDRVRGSSLVVLQGKLLARPDWPQVLNALQSLGVPFAMLSDATVKSRPSVSRLPQNVPFVEAEPNQVSLAVFQELLRWAATMTVVSANAIVDMAIDEGRSLDARSSDGVDAESVRVTGIVLERLKKVS